MNLHTERLTISPLGLDDLDAFVAYRRHVDVARYQSWTPDFSPADGRALIDSQPNSFPPPPGEWLQLALHHTSSGTLLGDVAVHTLDDQPDTYELGVTLAPHSQGSGFGTEAIRAVIEHLVNDDGAHRVIAFSDHRNTFVAALLTRVGMRLESTQLEADFFKGEWTTVDGWAILAREV